MDKYLLFFFFHIFGLLSIPLCCNLSEQPSMSILNNIEVSVFPHVYYCKQCFSPTYTLQQTSETLHLQTQ